MKSWFQEKFAPYLVSMPERALRSLSGLSAGLVRELSEITMPRAIRRGRLYQNLVEATLRFMIEKVGNVEGVYPTGEQLSEDFLLRRTAGSGIELIGLLAFRASPVWVLAALADISGGGRYLIQEITSELKREGLLEADAQFSNVDQMLDGLERSAGRLAENINSPPLDVAGLRKEWASLRADLKSIPPGNLPSGETVRDTWSELKRVSAAQDRSIFEMSSVLALDAINALPEKIRWLSSAARLATGRTGEVVAGAILTHYRETLARIHETGYAGYVVRQFRPYLYAAALQFSPQHQTLTQRLISSRKRS